MPWKSREGGRNHRQEGLVSRIILGLFFVLTWSKAASAQQPGRYVFGVGGPVFVPESAFSRWNGTLVYLGGGVESRIGNNFAMGGERRALSKITSGGGYTAGMAAATPAFHFMAKDSPSKFDPFINGGVSVMFNTGSVSLPMALFGGGLNYSVSPRLGMRFEYRDHVWSPEAEEWVQLAAFRVGMVYSF